MLYLIDYVCSPGFCENVKVEMVEENNRCTLSRVGISLKDAHLNLSLLLLGTSLFVVKFNNYMYVNLKCLTIDTCLSDGS